MANSFLQYHPYIPGNSTVSASPDALSSSSRRASASAWRGSSSPLPSSAAFAPCAQPRRLTRAVGTDAVAVLRCPRRGSQLRRRLRSLLTAGDQLFRLELRFVPLCTPLIV